MHYKVDRAFEGLSAVGFVQEFVEMWDTRLLGEFKIRTSKVCGGRYKGIHGNCKPPNPFKGIEKFRISCSISGTDEDFPKTGAARHAGTVRPEYVAQNVNELLAWVCGHELFHFLGKRTSMFYLDGTGQINTFADSERAADLMGYEFMFAVREGRSPVEVADAVSGGTTELLAPHRFPYKK